MRALIWEGVAGEQMQLAVRRPGTVSVMLTRWWDPPWTGGLVRILILTDNPGSAIVHARDIIICIGPPVAPSQINARFFGRCLNRHQIGQPIGCRCSSSGRWLKDASSPFRVAVRPEAETIQPGTALTHRSYTACGRPPEILGILPACGYTSRKSRTPRPSSRAASHAQASTLGSSSSW
jgi:hypothetical protein